VLHPDPFRDIDRLRRCLAGHRRRPPASPSTASACPSTTKSKLMSVDSDVWASQSRPTTPHTGTSVPTTPGVRAVGWGR
jgi:hypothetical protein